MGRGRDQYPALPVDVGDLALIPDLLAAGGLGSWVPAHPGRAVQCGHDRAPVAAHDRCVAASEPRGVGD